MTDRLPSLRPKVVLRVLERAGFTVVRTSGSHCRLIYHTDPNRKVTIPMHNNDLKRGTLRSIIAQAGLTVQEFIELL